MEQVSNGRQKYDYDNAVELMKTAYNENKTVTYERLQEVLGLENPIEDKSAKSATAGALHTLRERLRSIYGLTFKSAVTGKNFGPEFFYYTVTKLKDGNVSKKDSAKLKKNEPKKDEAFEALQRNNQQLYTALEQAKAANAALQNHCVKLQEREQEYKKIIDSLYKLSFS